MTTNKTHTPAKEGRAGDKKKPDDESTTVMYLTISAWGGGPRTTLSSFSGLWTERGWVGGGGGLRDDKSGMIAHTMYTRSIPDRGEVIIIITPMFIKETSLYTRRHRHRHHHHPI